MNQYTASQSNTPLPRDYQESYDIYSEELDTQASEMPVRLVTQFRGNVIAQYTGVIVEAWDHKNYGRGKRGYLATFTEQERKAIARLHTRAYDWCMRRGHPDYISMRMETFYLLQRAANFFASI